MGAAFAFLGILVLSLIVALLAALQLADHFRTGDEFAVVLAVLAAFAAGSMAVLGIVSARAANARSLNRAAMGLALLALILAALPGGGLEWIAGRASDPFSIDEKAVQIAIQLVAPTLLAVLVQWGLLRHRWLRIRSGEDLTRWPWVTTIVAGIAILNPIGLEFIASAIRQSQTDWLRQFTLMVTLSGLTAIALMGLVEFTVRGWMLRRRLADNRPPLPEMAG